MVVHFVVPLLRLLGWPIEQIAVNWRKMDVVVFSELPRTPETCRFVVEAKRFGDGIEGATDQAKKYITDLGSPPGVDVIVTDGIRFRVYTADTNFVEDEYANLAYLKEPATNLFKRIQRPSDARPEFL